MKLAFSKVFEPQGTWTCYACGLASASIVEADTLVSMFGPLTRFLSPNLSNSCTVDAGFAEPCSREEKCGKPMGTCSSRLIPGFRVITWPRFPVFGGSQLLRFVRCHTLTTVLTIP